MSSDATPNLPLSPEPKNTTLPCKQETTPPHHLPSIKIQVPTPNKQQNQITPNKRGQNAKIPPPMTPRNAKRLIELIAHAVRTVRAIRSLVVGNVARSARREEGGHVLSASLAGWGGEAVELDVGADHGFFVEFVGHQAGDEAGEAGWSVSERLWVRWWMDGGGVKLTDPAGTAMRARNLEFAAWVP